jgi:hypothetical protein
MTAWNFAPYRERTRSLQKAGWCVAVAFAALTGAMAATWAVNEAQTHLMQQ